MGELRELLKSLSKEDLDKVKDFYENEISNRKKNI